MSVARRVARAALWPIRRVLDPRFADINRRLHGTRQEIAHEGAATRVALDGVTGTVDRIVGTQMRELEAGVGELGAEVQRLGDAIEDRALRRRLEQLAEGRMQDLDWATAELLNYAGSHRGFAAQAQLWLNPPLVIEHAEGEVRLSHVNERIVEIPFALRALARLEPGARVLDFGSSESSLALSLASLGYEVTALDLRPYPFEHPKLTAVASPIEEWAGEAGSFDAALCVSTVEHVGLGWYDDPRDDRGGDRRALDRIAELLRPDGLLILTVPYGAPGVNAVQRRYDRAGLDALMAGWEILERLVVEQVDDRTWHPAEDSDGDAVALVVARRPQPR